MINQYPQKSKRCKICGNYLFYYLEKVYKDGNDELVCSRCKFGIKMGVKK